MTSPRQCQTCGAVVSVAQAEAEGWKRLHITAQDIRQLPPQGRLPLAESIGAATLCAGCYRETLHWVNFISCPFGDKSRRRP